MKVCFIGSDLTYKGGIQNLSSNLIIHMSHEPKIDEISVMCDVIDEEVFKLIKQDKLKIHCAGKSQKRRFAKNNIEKCKIWIFFQGIREF